MENAQAIADTLDLSSEDREYLLALAQTKARTWRERARAWGAVWGMGSPPLTAPPDGPHEAWLQEQPLLTWLAMYASASLGPDAAVEDVATRLRPRPNVADLRPHLEALAARGLLARENGSPHRQPTSRRIAEEATRLTGRAQAARWARDGKNSDGFTFGTTAEELDLVLQRLHALAARFRGLWDDDGEETLLAQLVVVPVTRTVQVRNNARSDTADGSIEPVQPSGGPWDNPLRMAWQDVARARMDTLRLNQQQMASAMGMSPAGISKILSHQQDIHQSGDDTTLDKLCLFLRLDGADERAEFRHLVNTTHPNPSVRAKAAEFLTARKALGSMLTAAPDARRRGRRRWHDTVIAELELLGARARTPEALANHFTPPLMIEDAIEGLQRAAHRDSYVVVEPEAPVERRTADVIHHVQWLDVVQAQLASGSCEATYLSTQLLTVPAGALAEALILLREELTVLVPAVKPPEQGEARVYHLRANLLVVGR